MNSRQPKRFAVLTFGMAAILGTAVISRARARDVRLAPAAAEGATSAAAGAAPAADPVPPADTSATDDAAADRAMLWKYVARCALGKGQSVEGPDGGRVEGSLGLAPEWRDGTCDVACQEKVSACLYALTNPTGKHVEVSLLGHDASLPREMRPSRSDLPYEYQEGAFFGNVFAGEAYVCRGRDAGKGAQVKRWCAIEPALCSGLADFVDSGPCQRACDMSCSRLPDGSERCVAVRCRDPRGHVWTRAITTYLRNRIEAGNADEIAHAAVREQSLEEIEDGASASYRAVDFGRRPGATRALVARLGAARAGGRIEVWLGNRRRLGVLTVPATGPEPRDVTARLAAEGLAGPQDLVLRFSGVDRRTTLATVGLR
jgi:hypothetical protein